MNRNTLTSFNYDLQAAVGEHNMIRALAVKADELLALKHKRRSSISSSLRDVLKMNDPFQSK